MPRLALHEPSLIRKQLDEAEATVALKRAEAINAIVKSAHASLNSNDSKLKKQQQQQQQASGDAASAAAAAAEPSVAAGADDSAPRLPEPGDLVFVPKLQKRASVLRVKNGKKPQVDLKVGSLTISAKIDEVELLVQ